MDEKDKNMLRSLINEFVIKCSAELGYIEFDEEYLKNYTEEAFINSVLKKTFMKKLHHKIVHKTATMQEWIKWETRERETEFWGDKINIKPVIATQKIGDGKQLVYLGTIDQRPNYWLLRIDSRTDLLASDFDVETLLEILEDEFGKADEDDERIFDAIDKIYPAILWAEGHYGSLFISEAQPISYVVGG